MTFAAHRDLPPADAKARNRVLEHLSKFGNYLARDPLGPERVLMVAGAHQPSIIRGNVPAHIIADLLSDGVLVTIGGAAGRIALSDAGQALYRRMAAGTACDAYQSQHQDRRQQTLTDDEGSILVNDNESPLAWLRRRKNRDGSPMLDETRFIAGERLRADMTRAQTMPRVTSNWTAAVATSARHGGSPDPAEAMVAAQQRVRRALDAVGNDLAGVLIDVCGFLKGLADIERERQWPARSGKVVLDIALGRLAAHYGLSAQAFGAERRSGKIEIWAASDARPHMTGVQPASAAAS